MSSHFRSSIAAALGALCLGVTIAGAAHATITVVADYRLGENDAGAAPGVVSTGTADSSGNNFNLTTAAGAPVYSADTAPIPSSLSVSFDGRSFFSGPTVTNATENFGMEAWVKTSDIFQDSGIAINGSGCCSGFGLVMGDGQYSWLYGGINVLPFGPVTADTWTEIAVVNQDGATTAYLNGVAVPFGFAGDPHPASAPVCCSPPLDMTIGGDGTHQYDGLIDDVRVFTFADGQFSVSDLDVPEPASLAVLGAGLAGLRLVRRKRR